MKVSEILRLGGDILELAGLRGPRRSTGVAAAIGSGRRDGDRSRRWGSDGGVGDRNERLFASAPGVTDMATETQTGLSSYLRGVTVTTLACLCGIGAAFASAVIVGTGAEAASDVRSVFVLAAFVVGQYPVLRVIGVDVGDFGVKDHLYVAFMTFALWFITYAIMLTTGVVV